MRMLASYLGKSQTFLGNVTIVGLLMCLTSHVAGPLVEDALAFKLK
jgi:hypothetical protein